MNKLTTEEVRKRVEDIGGIFIGPYTYANNKCKFKCPKCNDIFKQTLHKCLRNNNPICPKCSLIEGSIKLIKINYDIIDKIYNKNIKVIEYSHHKKINKQSYHYWKCLCLLCNNEIIIRQDALKRQKSCGCTSGNNLKNRKTWYKKRKEKALEKSNLEKDFPDLLIQWDYKLNKKIPKEYCG